MTTQQLIDARASACDDCDCVGTHVDTCTCDIQTDDMRQVCVADLIDTPLMVDPDGELRCDDCADRD